MNRNVVAIVLAVAMVIGWSLSGWAQGNIRVGKLEVTPGLGYDLEYNDNVFLEEDSEKDDWIHTITPSLFLDWEQDADNYARLGYKVDVFRYDDYSDTDYESHFLTAGAGYKSPQGFYASLNNLFLDTEDPYSSENDYRLGEKTKRWSNNLRLNAGYEFSPLTRLEFSYRNRILDYDEFEDEWQNRLSHEPGVALYYQIMPKTAAFVEYRFETTEYTEQDDLEDNNRGADSDNAQDYEYHKGYVGLAWDATAKINGELKFGYGYKDYDNEVSFRTDELGNHIEYDDVSTWIAETNLTYAMSPKTAFDARVLRETFDSPSSVDTTYDRTEVGFGLTQEMGRRMTLSADAAYILRDYDRTSREDDEWEVGLDLRYALMEWLAAGMRYEFDDRQSDVEEYEYTNNRVGLYMQAEY